MALSSATFPPSPALSRNPMLVKIQSVDGGGIPYGAYGVKTTLSGAITGRFTNGQTLTIAYTEANGGVSSIVFTAAGIPVGNQQIPSSASSGYTDTTYWEKIAATLRAHPRVGAFFKISLTIVSGNFTLVVQEKTAASGWTMSSATTSGFTLVNTSTVTADSTPANYRLHLQVFFEKTYLGGDFEQVADLESVPDADGWHYFDISEILDAEGRNSLKKPPIPTYGTAVPVLADNLRRYYVRFAEAYGSPVAFQSWTYGATQNVLLGGISQTLFATSPDWLTTRNDTTSILSWMPNLRRLDDETPEFLAWYNYQNADDSVVLEVVWTHRDTLAESTAAYQFDIPDKVSVQPNETLLIPVKPALLALANEANAYKFTVRVVKSSSDFEGGNPTYLSPARSYYLDREHYAGKRTLQYLNSFGCPETVRCLGERAKKMSVQREISTQILPPGYGSFHSDRAQFRESFDNEITYRTGFLDKLEADALQAMLLASEIFDVQQAGFFGILLTSNSFDVTDTFRALHTYTFNAVPRLKSKNYAFAAETDPVVASGNWEEPDGSFWLDHLNQPWEF